MPPISPTALVDAILAAISASGCSAVLLSAIREHPRRFAVRLPSGETVNLWVYIWTLTHGGRVALPNEFRIQMTSVESPLPHNPNGLTVLMGYAPDLDVFAGFDLNRHSQFTAGSPSVQIDIDALRTARHTGLTFSRKTNDEIAIGIRPDLFIDYTLHHHQLHRHGVNASDLRLLTMATQGQIIPPESLAPLPAIRQRLVQTVTRLSREANFREQVMRAYANRCAVTGIQLRLVDAAHILPVGATGSSDDVRNGLALTATYHRAFDNGLIYLNEHLQMVLNKRKLAELRAMNLAGGLDLFSAPLGRKILLPPDANQRPMVKFIKAANRYRRINE